MAAGEDDDERRKQSIDRWVMKPYFEVQKAYSCIKEGDGHVGTSRNVPSPKTDKWKGHVLVSRGLIMYLTQVLH